MTAVTLRLIDPEANKWRFYSLDIQPDLFGGWSLVREWGRIGRHGKVFLVYASMITLKAPYWSDVEML